MTSVSVYPKPSLILYEISGPIFIRESELSRTTKLYHYISSTWYLDVWNHVHILGQERIECPNNTFNLFCIPCPETFYTYPVKIVSLCNSSNYINTTFLSIEPFGFSNLDPLFLFLPFLLINFLMCPVFFILSHG